MHVWNRGVRRYRQEPRGAPRRSEAAGVPRLRLRRHRHHRPTTGDLAHAQAGRQARRCSTDDLERAPHRRTAAPASATPAGRPTAARPTATRTRTSATTAGSRVIHNGIIENFAALKDELLAEGFAFAARPTPRSPPCCSAASTARPATSPRRSAASSRASRARSRCSRCTRTSRGVVVGARRNSPLVIGLGDGENFLGSDVAAFVEHTRNARRDRPGPDRHDHARTRVDRHRLRRRRRSRSSRSRSRGMPPPPRRAAGRRFMAKEISEEPEAVANTLRGRIARRRRSPSPSSTRSATTSSPASTASSIIACGTAAYAGHGRQVRDREVGARARRGRAQPRVPLPRPGARRRARSSSRSASPARRWTR